MTRSRRAGLSRDEVRQQPLYARMLGLQYLAPSGFLCFVFLEGAVALGILLALAELVSWWGVLVLPVTVAAMVKLNDVVAGALTRPQVRTSGGGGRSGAEFGGREPGSRGAETVRIPESLIANVSAAPPTRPAGLPMGGGLPSDAGLPPAGGLPTAGRVEGGRPTRVGEGPTRTFERVPADGPVAPPVSGDRWAPESPGRFTPVSADRFTADSTDRLTPDGAGRFTPGSAGRFAPDSAGRFSPDGAGRFAGEGASSFDRDPAASFTHDGAGSLRGDSPAPFPHGGGEPFPHGGGEPFPHGGGEPFPHGGGEPFPHGGGERWAVRDGEQQRPAGPPIGAEGFVVDPAAMDGVGGPLHASGAAIDEPGMFQSPRTVQQWASSQVDDHQQRARQSAARRYE
ncbi:hypothetical protein GCM10010166_58070 [Couchioplanes caeruleus subsp. azureus]|nr:hypothetical protein GCM10010166_58070 [Couchioplanes caeruleus subsp. azureus]